MGNHNAATPSYADVTAAFAAAESDTDPTVTVTIGAGTANWNLGNVSYNFPPNTTITGAGIGQTIIIDDYASSNALFYPVTHADGTFTMSGIEIRQGTGLVKGGGLVSFYGSCHSFRLHHCEWNMQTGTPNQSNCGQIQQDVRGVVDNCSFYLNSVGNGLQAFNGVDTPIGHTTWAQATGFGGSDFIYFEDNYYEGNFKDGAATDSYHGGKFVARFNSSNVMFQQHFTAGGVLRSGRALEMYCNEFRGWGGGLYATRNLDYMGGPAIVWGNQSVSTANQLVEIHSKRQRPAPYDQGAPPDGWGWAGPGYKTGTVTVAGTTVTRTAGDNFSTSWPVGTQIFINGLTYDVASFDSTTQLTLSNTHAYRTASQAYDGTVASNGSYVIGSNWDGNTDVRGYPNIDQIGRGVGDTLSGDFPSVTNVDNGSATYSSANAWPRQALEPAYIFENTFTAAAGGGLVGVNDAPNVVADRDYYTDEVVTFDGTSGIGSGTYAQMQAITPTHTNVGFWVTDRGSWNAGTNSIYTGQGQLWKWNGSAWAFYYEPYTYPHPLRGESAPAEETTPIQPTTVRKTRFVHVKKGRKF